eukprot:127374-Rhodomonas_salina.1
MELCNDMGKLDASGFKIMLKRQLKLFVQRQMVNAMAQSEVLPPSFPQASRSIHTGDPKMTIIVSN